MNTAHLVDPELRPLLADMPERELEASDLPAMREQRQAAALESLSQDDGLPVTVTQHHISGGEDAPAVRVLVISPQHERKGRMGILHIHGGGYVLGSAAGLRDCLGRLSSCAGNTFPRSAGRLLCRADLDDRTGR